MDSKTVFWLVIIAGFTAVFFGVFFVILYTSNRELRDDIRGLQNQIKINKSKADLEIAKANLEIAKLRLAAVLSGVNIDRNLGGKENGNEQRESY